MYINKLLKHSKFWKKHATTNALKLYDQLREIKSFQVFHLGEVNSYDPLIKAAAAKGKAPLQGEHIRLPYPYVYFDFTSNAFCAPIKGAEPNRFACFCWEGNFKEDNSRFICTMPFRHSLYTFNVARGKHKTTALWEPDPYLYYNDISAGEYRYDRVYKDYIDYDAVEEDDKYQFYHQYVISVVHMAIEMLNCRNIEAVPASEVEGMPRKKMTGKKELVDYRVLVVTPVGKSTKNSKPKHLWRNRAHLYRGHFKTYTKEKPLFGKYVGRYWWQAGLRGSNKEGLVLKDYEVAHG
jgi:hypothetical protein